MIPLALWGARSIEAATADRSNEEVHAAVLEAIGGDWSFYEGALLDAVVELVPGFFGDDARFAQLRSPELASPGEAK